MPSGVQQRRHTVTMVSRMRHVIDVSYPKCNYYTKQIDDKKGSYKIELENHCKQI